MRKIILADYEAIIVSDEFSWHEADKEDYIIIDEKKITAMMVHHPDWVYLTILLDGQHTIRVRFRANEYIKRIADCDKFICVIGG